ncbi:MAG: LptE family protein [Kiritimatiellae bacterium]|nr:LptE family protein [Kiritimatiellia bacterium]
MKIRTWMAAVAAAVAVWTAGGCAGYRVGSMLPGDVKTVWVPTVQNKTQEPFIEQDVTSALMAALQMDGSLKVADEKDADAVLRVTVTGFRLDPVAYESGTSNTAEEYRMTLTAGYVLQRTADGTVVAESPAVRGWEDFDFTGDLTSSKAVALRPAAEDLGRRIVDAIVMYWP